MGFCIFLGVCVIAAIIFYLFERHDKKEHIETNKRRAI